SGPPGWARLGVGPRVGGRDDGGGGFPLCELHLDLGATPRSRGALGSPAPHTAAFGPPTDGSTGSALLVHRVLRVAPVTRTHGAEQWGRSPVGEGAPSHRT